MKSLKNKINDPKFITSIKAIAKKEFEEITKNAIHRHAHIKNCVNSSGDFIENSS